jgi:hypothetical protein
MKTTNRITSQNERPHFRPPLDCGRLPLVVRPLGLLTVLAFLTFGTLSGCSSDKPGSSRVSTEALNGDAELSRPSPLNRSCQVQNQAHRVRAHKVMVWLPLR